MGKVRTHLVERFRQLPQLVSASGHAPQAVGIKSLGLDSRRDDRAKTYSGGMARRLNLAAADATGRRVVTGPIEATAIGNILMQMLAVGQINSLSEGREIVRRSFPVETYEPQEDQVWVDAYERFLALSE